MGVTSRSRSGDHINVRVDASVSRVRIADFEDFGGTIGSVHQVVAIRVTRLEGRTIAGLQGLFASIGHEGQLTLQHPNELVLMAVPVALAGPTTWWNHCQIDAKES